MVMRVHVCIAMLFSLEPVFYWMRSLNICTALHLDRAADLFAFNQNVDLIKQYFLDALC